MTPPPGTGGWQVSPFLQQFPRFPFCRQQSALGKHTARGYRQGSGLPLLYLPPQSLFVPGGEWALAAQGHEDRQPPTQASEGQE